MKEQLIKGSYRYNVSENLCYIGDKWKSNDADEQKWGEEEYLLKGNVSSDIISVDSFIEEEEEKKRGE